MLEQLQGRSVSPMEIVKDQEQRAGVRCLPKERRYSIKEPELGRPRIDHLIGFTYLWKYLAQLGSDACNLSCRRPQPCPQVIGVPSVGEGADDLRPGPIRWCPTRLVCAPPKDPEAGF